MTEILRLDGLEVHFRVRGGPLDALLGRPAGVVRAVDGRYPGLAGYLVDERGALRKHVELLRRLGCEVTVAGRHAQAFANKITVLFWRVQCQCDASD